MPAYLNNLQSIRQRTKRRENALKKTGGTSEDGCSDKGEEVKLDESPCDELDEETKYPDFISAIFSAVGQDGKEDHLADNN